MPGLPHILRCHPLADCDIVSGHDVFLHDTHGRTYTDFESGIWCTPLGHCESRIAAVIRTQLNNVIHLAPQLTSSLAEAAARELLKYCPFDDGKAVFLSSGSEAMEFGIRLALRHTQRDRVLTFDRSYLAAYGIGSKQREGDTRYDIELARCLACEVSGCSWSCPALTHIKPSTVGAFAFEPILASAGVLTPPDRVIRFLAREIRDHGGLVVADEVTTGLGRTGRWLGIDHFDVQPDIIVFGKGLGNGYPISAVVMRTEIAARAEESGLRYVQSHQNDPLGCAVAREVLAILESDRLVERAAEVGPYMLKCLSQLRRRCPGIKDVRGKGLMLAVDLRTAEGFCPSLIDRIVDQMLTRGFVIGAKPEFSLLRFMPAFTMPTEEIDRMCANLEVILTDVFAN